MVARHVVSAVAHLWGGRRGHRDLVLGCPRRHGSRLRCEAGHACAGVQRARVRPLGAWAAEVRGGLERLGGTLWFLLW
jgi:hypothetical protein